jgi:hypothetical protein
MPKPQQASDENLERIDARFQERLEQVPVLRQRADAEGIKSVTSLEELVPLLFPHTVYKSYPPALVEQGRWAQMNKWLDSTSVHRVDVDVDGVTDIDGWIERLGQHGHLVSASSGTTGKSSFLNKSEADIEAALDAHFVALAMHGVLPDNSWNLISTTPDAGNIVGKRSAERLRNGMARPDGVEPFVAPPPAEGHQAYMARLTKVRRAVADGSATPDEIAAMEEDGKRRQAESRARMEYYAGEVLARPSEKFLFGSMMAMAWQFVGVMREKGAEPGTLTGPNALFMAGGTKGAVLPDDAEAQILAMFNVDSHHFAQHYSMQEINVSMPRCENDRYHVRPDLQLVLLDEPAEQLVPLGDDGRAEGRAAFFDFTVDGRWGGTISGDQIEVDYNDCSCGRPGPTVARTITRFANKADGDKITCAGTMDAYVRGFVQDEN